MTKKFSILSLIISIQCLACPVDQLPKRSDQWAVPTFRTVKYDGSFLRASTNEWGKAIPVLSAKNAWMAMPYQYQPSKCCFGIIFLFNWKDLSDFFLITRKFELTLRLLYIFRPYVNPQCQVCQVLYISINMTFPRILASALQDHPSHSVTLSLFDLSQKKTLLC